MPKITLTARGLDGLKAKGIQTDYFDDGANVPGFGIRVAATGRKTWFLMYRANGRQKRHTLGTYKPMGLHAARTAARTALLGVQVEDADPAAAKKARRNAQTFGQLADRYLTLYAKAKKRSWREDGRQLRSMVLPRWKNRPAFEISKGDVSRLIDEIVEKRGGVTANRLLALLSKLFRWAVSREELDANPAAGLKKPAAETSRERALSDDELRAFWQRLDAAERDATLPAAVVLWLRLRLLTAQRGGSVEKMKWANIDLAAKVWEIPAADMKGKKPHVVPLSASVCELLEARRQAVSPDATYVLEGGRSRRLRLGIIDAIGLEDFRPHDLRRTATTGMARAGVSRFIQQRVLGHVDRSVTGIYDRYEYLNEKRIALDTWARTVSAILSGTSGNVVAFAR